MLSYTALVSLTAIFALLSVFFLGLGLYAVDFSLLIIAGLFAVAGLLSRLEMQELS